MHDCTPSGRLFCNHHAHADITVGTSDVKKLACTADVLQLPAHEPQSEWASSNYWPQRMPSDAKYWDYWDVKRCPFCARGFRYTYTYACSEPYQSACSDCPVCLCISSTERGYSMPIERLEPRIWSLAREMASYSCNF